jgi:hypothetical protein
MKTNKWKALDTVRRGMESRGISLTIEDMAALRRCEVTLHRWGELECGDGNDYASWAIERDETTGKPYMVTYRHDGNGAGHRQPIADREAGALKRAAKICQRNGLHLYHQTDPRGVQLYVAKEPLTDKNYTNGAACNA